MSRKKAEEFIIKEISEVLKYNKDVQKHNVELYKDLFKSMTNNEFDIFMKNMEENKVNLQVIIPNGTNAVKVENNLKISERLGHSSLQPITIYDGDDVVSPPNDAYIIDIPIRRVIQTVDKKVSIADDVKSVNTITGQVTNASKSSRITLPETQVLLGLGLEKSLVEMLKYRAGDIGGEIAFEKMISGTGIVSQDMAKPYSTGSSAIHTLKQILLAAHLDNNI